MNRFYFGLDLGQSMDYTALAIIENIPHIREHKTVNQLRHIKRFKLGTPYPQIVKEVKETLRHKSVNPHEDRSPILVVDGTGVGAPVVDMFHEANLYPYVIKIHGGDIMTSDGQELRLPKRDLVGILQRYFQNKTLKIASKLDFADILINELLSFKVKINTKTAHDSYEAWREGDHDDLVIAVAMACYIIEYYGGSDIKDGTDFNTEDWPEEEEIFMEEF